MRRSRLIQAYHEVFNGGESANMVLHHLMKENHMLSSTHIQGERTHDSAFREGERNVVLKILGVLKVSPAEMEKMASEARYYKIEDENYDR